MVDVLGVAIGRATASNHLALILCCTAVLGAGSMASTGALLLFAHCAIAPYGGSSLSSTAVRIRSTGVFGRSVNRREQR